MVVLHIVPDLLQRSLAQPAHTAPAMKDKVMKLDQLKDDRTYNT